MGVNDAPQAPPRPDAAAQVFLETWCAEDYDRDRFGGRFGAWLERREVELVLDLLGDAGRSLLDAGAGTGKLSLPLLERGHDVTSVDLSLAMLQIAKEKMTSLGRSARVSVADLQALAFRDRAFDCVVSSRVLMHLPDWRAGVAELCRVTRRTLVLDFPARWSVAGIDAFRKRRAAAGKAVGPRRAYRTFRARDVIAEIERHGLQVRAARRAFVLPVLLHRKIDRPWLTTILEGALALPGLRRLLGTPVTLKAVRV